MNILRNISIFWSLLHTLILFFILFESRYSKKKTLTLTLITMGPLSLLNGILAVILDPATIGTLLLFTLSLPSLIFFWFLAKNRDGRFFFTFCMIDTTVLEIMYITQIINYHTTPDSFLVMFLIRLIAYPLLELWIYKKLRVTYLDVQSHTKNGWWLFATIGALFYVFISLLVSTPSSITERPEYYPVVILFFIIMPLIYLNIILTLFRQQHYYQMIEEENILRLQTSNVITRVEELAEANEKFREERHNFRHKMKTIASLVESQQYDELALLVEEYKEVYQKTAVTRYCKNAILDAVFSAYIKRAENLGISVQLGLAFPDVIPVNETELATAFANAIENAIHACEKLPPQKRFIEIKVISKPKFIAMIKNSFDGNAEFDDEGIPINHDEDHGFGTRSIAAFCNKIGGHYEFKAHDDVFTLYMHLS